MTHKQLAKMFKALSNPTRLQLYISIFEAGESEYGTPSSCFLHHITDRLNVGAPTVSHHLKELVNADLITTDKRGKFVTCRVNPDAQTTLSQFLKKPM